MVDLKSAQVTMTVGEILLMIYHAMAIIVLVNMLIAMMSNSFQTIQASQVKSPFLLISFNSLFVTDKKKAT